MLKAFFSLKITIFLLFIYALACGVATFVENDFGTSAAKALVYNTLWFDVLHFLLLINLLGVIFLHKLFQRKKYASLLLHSAFVVILFGAFLTRYFGIEGGMHIREFQSSSTIVTRNEFINLNIFDKNENLLETKAFQVNFNPFFKASFEKKLKIKDKILNLTLLEYQNKENQILKMKISFNGKEKELFLSFNYNDENTLPFELGGEIFSLNFTLNELKLPFSIALKDFVLERYAGSNSPSAYSSFVEVIDNNKSFEYKIFMNNVLDYGGYRFFQSSYDLDEKGTILSVNKDPGKIVTYLGYALLILGFLCVFFAKNSRFSKLSNYLKEHKSLALILPCFFTFCVPNYADTIKLLQDIKTNAYEHSLKFGALQVQDFDGRIKPLDTLAMNYIHKITKKSDFLGLNYNQLFLAMMMHPNELKNVKMISIKSPKLKEILGVKKTENYIAYNDVFNENSYKLANFIEEANRKKASQKDQFDKEILALDEKINLAFYIYYGQVFRVFPDSKTDIWYSPSSNMPFSQKDIEDIQTLLAKYFFDFEQGLISKDFKEADKSLKRLKTYQIQNANNALSENKISLELFLNHYNIFNNLGFAYFTLGILLFFMLFYELLSLKKIPNFIKNFIVFLIILSSLLHLISLCFRWYIGEHAPWSNAYESMIFIAFSFIVAGLIFYKNSPLTLCIASIMAGISLFVAHLGFMDPQITNLVPVLKSYWLNIHVFIITASYGFLGLCFLLGAFILLLFILRTLKKEHIERAILNLHCINEMSMIIGLALLTIGNFLGGVWANESWGRYWGWDSKETWSLISIITYTIILHLRFIPSLNNPFSFASASVLGFYSILMTYFGVNFYLSGLHSYASGDRVELPAFLYALIFFNLTLIFLAFFKRKLKSPI